MYDLVKGENNAWKLNINLVHAVTAVHTVYTCTCTVATPMYLSDSLSMYDAKLNGRSISTAKCSKGNGTFMHMSTNLSLEL